MATFRVTITKQVDQLVLVEADTEEEARATLDAFGELNPTFDIEGETPEGVQSFTTLTTDSFITVTKED